MATGRKRGLTVTPTSSALSGERVPDARSPAGRSSAAAEPLPHLRRRSDPADRAGLGERGVDGHHATRRSARPAAAPGSEPGRCRPLGPELRRTRLPAAAAAPLPRLAGSIRSGAWSCFGRRATRLPRSTLTSRFTTSCRVAGWSSSCGGLDRRRRRGLLGPAARRVSAAYLRLGRRRPGPRRRWRRPGQPVGACHRRRRRRPARPCRRRRGIRHRGPRRWQRRQDGEHA